MSKNPLSGTPFGMNLSYSLPTIGYGFMYLLFAMYYLKFATDVLYVAPAIIGVIFGFARLWDAALDPAVGYLSDRTTHSMGRRRPWLLFGAIVFATNYGDLSIEVLDDDTKVVISHGGKVIEIPQALLRMLLSKPSSVTASPRIRIRSEAVLASGSTIQRIM